MGLYRHDPKFELAAFDQATSPATKGRQGFSSLLKPAFGPMVSKEFFQEVHPPNPSFSGRAPPPAADPLIPAAADPGPRAVPAAA